MKTQRRRWIALIGVLVWVICGTTSSIAESQPVVVPLSADGIQRIEISMESYAFQPSHLVVKANIPVEITLKNIARLTPHDFVLSAPEAGLDIKQEVSAGEAATVRFTPKSVGAFKFLCSKRLLFFKSHADRGMAGILEVKP